VDLYLDVDDTIIRWLDDDHREVDGVNPYGAGRDMWRPDYELLSFVWDARASFEHVYIWSGGGALYAYEWRSRVAPWTDDAFAKDVGRPRRGDICVDDQYASLAPRSAGVLVVSPGHFKDIVGEAVHQHRGWPHLTSS